MAFMTKDALVINTMIYSYSSRLVTPLYSFLKKNNNYIEGGYVENHQVIEKSKKENIKPSRWTLKDHQVEYMNKCIKLLKDKNIEVILTMAPVTQEFLNSVTNSDEIFKKMDSLIIYPNNIKSLNYNSTEYLSNINLETERDFYDLNHMNSSGVRKFNVDLINELTTNVKSFSSFHENFKNLIFVSDNLVKNHDFSQGLNHWNLKGDSNLINVTNSKLQFNSTSELSGISQFILDSNEYYIGVIDVERIEKGGLKFFTGYEKVTNIKEGLNIFKFKSGDKSSVHIYRNGVTKTTINSIQIVKSDDNIILNSDFNFGLTGWKTKGDVDYIPLKGINLISNDGELSGISQSCLQANTNYEVKINISKIEKGGLKVFNGSSNLNIDLHEGVNVFTFKSNNNNSIHIYRKQGICNAMIKSIKVWLK